MAPETARMTAALPPSYLQNFRRRVIQDAFNEATASYWRRRAATFEWARPRPPSNQRGGWPGRASATDLRAQDQRLEQIAQACRNMAAVAPWSDVPW